MRVTRPLVVLLATATLALTGCGVASTQFHPGVAAQVGGQTITTDEVDDLTTGYCKALVPQLNDQAIPLGLVRNLVVESLSLREAAGQLADQLGVEPGQASATANASLEKSLATLPKDQQHAVRVVEQARSYLSDVLTTIGRDGLVATGTSAPDNDASLAAGQKALGAWIDSHDVELDPRYDLTLSGDAASQQVDTSLSTAVSALAKGGAPGQAQPPASYTKALPSSQTCG